LADRAKHEPPPLTEEAIWGGSWGAWLINAQDSAGRVSLPAPLLQEILVKAFPRPKVAAPERMKLRITRRARNLRTRRVEAWEAATPCGTYTAMRIEAEDTPWALFFHRTDRNGNLMKAQGLFGSLRAAQRHVDRTEAKTPTEAPRT
jgi:hypothetical protein